MNIFLYLIGLGILAIQNIYLLSIDSPIWTYIIVTGLTILYGACFSLSELKSKANKTK